MRRACEMDIRMPAENLEGILYTPENLDPSGKYPMLVYFYEKSSDELYITRYLHQPGRSSIFPGAPATAMLFLFLILSTGSGYPGQSAYDAVVSGTQLHDWPVFFYRQYTPGFQGQSWGGYQVAYLVTRTGFFRAAMAGAPVSNMTSAYGGIRWGTGMSRMFQYERTQSRMGATLWENPDLYIENSPLFFVPGSSIPLC